MHLTAGREILEEIRKSLQQKSAILRYGFTNLPGMRYKPWTRLYQNQSHQPTKHLHSLKFFSQTDRGPLETQQPLIKRSYVAHSQHPIILHDRPPKWASKRKKTMKRKRTLPMAVQSGQSFVPFCLILYITTSPSCPALLSSPHRPSILPMSWLLAVCPPSCYVYGLTGTRKAGEESQSFCTIFASASVIVFIHYINKSPFFELNVNTPTVQPDGSYIASWGILSLFMHIILSRMYITE